MPLDPMYPAEQTGPGEEQIQRLDEMGASLVRSRKSAIEARFASGIEHEWIEDQDSYEGLDDANRASEHKAGRNRWRKPATINGSFTDKLPPSTRSTVFLNITRPYTDSAAARVGDMLLPSDDKAWALTPTPIPELTSQIQAQLSQVGVQQGDVDQIKAQIEAQVTAGKESAAKAEKRIEDWHVECHWHAQARMVVDDVAQMGTGILKGPFPEKKRQTRWTNVNGQTSLEVHEEIKPVSKRIDCWNFYPDGRCGENIQNGEFTWERDDITSKTLRGLKGTPGYIDYQIDMCLEDGPKKAVVVVDADGRAKNESTFEIWYFHGTLTREDMEAAGCDCMDVPESQVAIPAIVTMVNERVIKAALNPMGKGDFPYDLMPWQERRGMPWGIGVPRQVRTPQRMIVGASRNLMDNAGLSAGPQIIVFKDVIEPADKSWEITPRKVWYANPNADVRQVEHAFTCITIESRQQELMAIIEFALKMAEDVTGLPMLMQGQQGTAPDTVGGMQILNNNASSVLRRVARLFDSRITEPHIQRYYDWLMEYGEDDSEKGVFIVNARGSTVLVERDIQNQAILQMATLVQTPSFGFDPRKYGKEVCKAQRLDPKLFQYDDAQWAKIQENAAQQPTDPAIMVAQLKNEFEQNALNQQNQLRQLEMNFEAQQAAADRQVEVWVNSIKREIAVIELAGKKEMSTDQLKVMLAKTALVERNKAAIFNAEKQLALKTGEGI